jgi:hypothetical protein
MDRAYVDWRRLYAIEQARAWFVVRAKKSLRYCRLHSQPVDPASGLRSDQIISLQAFYAARIIRTNSAVCAFTTPSISAGWYF